MVFIRTVPPRKYADYTRYRPYLRKDFRYRCAYCLRQEGHNGGEANFCIDHHRPMRGPFGRPDLQRDYANLYYVCCECNENKADHWPTEAELQQGLRFIDPCQPGDDHDLHWRFHPDGSIQSLTNVGKYTEVILLLWRPQLQHWRAAMYQLQQKADEIEQVLLPLLSPEDRAELQNELLAIKAEIDPPVFDRPRVSGRSARNRRTD